ncbi:MAG: hypothetical protein ACRD13_09150, partial [Terriglobales bacterium]
AVELAVQLHAQEGGVVTGVCAAIFFLIASFFIYRSFYGMRIARAATPAEAEREPARAAGD